VHDVISVREMTADDAAWAAGLMERRRQAYAGYSPVFWRPRPGVTGLHARFLGRQIGSPGYVALRTGHGFLIGQRRGPEGFVDDFPVLQVSDLAGDADLAGVERDAAGMGAVLLVVPAAPGSERAARLGKRPGWSVASDWYLGRPR
jgi:hypothetical protein